MDVHRHTWRHFVDRLVLRHLAGPAPSFADRKGQALFLLSGKVVVPNSCEGRRLLRCLADSHIGLVDWTHSGPEFECSHSDKIFHIGRAAVLGIFSDEPIERLATECCLALHSGDLVAASDFLVWMSATATVLLKPPLLRFRGQAIAYLKATNDIFPESTLTLSIALAEAMAYGRST